MIRHRKQRDLDRPAAPALDRRRQRIARSASAIIEAALPAFLIAGILVAATDSAAVLDNLDFGPPVGQILTFGPYSQPGPVWHVTVARAPGQRPCVLQPAIMATAPGSMVVESRSADGRVYRAHWAGGPTSDHASDCGAAADLTIALAAMQTLVNADALGRQRLVFIGP